METMTCKAQGPHSHLTDKPMGPYSSLDQRPSTHFAPGPYRGPQRRNPEPIDSSEYAARLQSQVDEFRRNADK
jgi:hypothetical protein